jgi:serine/threonine protein kinase
VGRYELLRRLGRGGMAEVFLARRRGPGGVEKRLAVKRIRRERARDPRFLDLFVEEARLSMTLAHKNIVPTFDFGRVGDELFLVMEYVDGIDLGGALAAGAAADRPLPPQLAAYVALEACQALDFAHRSEEGHRPVIHRDVTPRNVLLSYHGEVKLVDFGVATGEVEVGGGVLRGTPGYMAPEQARGQPVDARSDVFALGLVLWEALSGRRAYRGATAAEVLAEARRAEVPPLFDEVPADLRAIAARATAPAPADRYASARDMQLALDQYVMTARRPGSAPPSVALAEWLTAVYPRQAARSDADLKAPEQALVTFLEERDEEINHGQASRVSMAETMAEPDQLSAPEVPAPLPPEPETRARWRFVLIGVLLLAAAGMALLLWNRNHNPSHRIAVTPVDAGAPPADARAVVQLAADAAPPVDAAPIAAPVDAAVHVRKRPDAGAVVRKPVDAGVAAEPGHLQVNSSPWAEVEVIGRGRKCSETPCTLDLPPGRYTLRLRNPTANVGTTREVTVVSGQTQTVIVTLTRPLEP